MRTIESPNAAELQWVEGNINRLRDFASQPRDHRFSLAELDSSYDRWMSSRASEEDANPMINAFGCAFGQYLVEHDSMSWVVVIDEHGTEIAVCGQPGEVLIFPPNFVAKRVVAKADAFFESTYPAISQDIAEMRRKAQHKPWWKVW